MHSSSCSNNNNNANANNFPALQLLGKRHHSSDGVDEPRKRAAMRLSMSPGNFSYLISDVLIKIFNCLPAGDLGAFAQTSKEAALFTEPYWKKLKIEQHIDFEWGEGPPAGPNHERLTYILNRALISLVRLKNNRSQTTVVARREKIKHRFEPIVRHSSSFRIFYLSELHRLGETDLIIESKKIENMVKKTLATRKNPKNVGNTGELKEAQGGELVIEGIFTLDRFDKTYKLSEKKLTKIQKKANEKGATCLSYLLLLNGLKRDDNVSDLALASSLKGDFGALDIIERSRYVSSNTAKAPEDAHASALLFHYGNRPIWKPYTAVQLNNHLLLLESCIDRALPLYASQTTPTHLLQASFCKTELGKYAEAEKLLSRALHCYGNSPQMKFELQVELFWVLCKQENFQQAEPYADIILKQGKFETRDSVFTYRKQYCTYPCESGFKSWKEFYGMAGQCKYKLAKYQAALESLKISLKLYEEQTSEKSTPDAIVKLTPAKLLGDIAWTYRQLKNYSQAAHYFQQAIILSKHEGAINDSQNYYHSTAATFQLLKNFVKAEEYYYLAIEAYGPNACSAIFESLAAVLVEQKKWDKALEYYEKAINSVNQKSSSSLYALFERLAEVHMGQQNWDKAAEYYEKAIMGLGEKTSALTISYAGLVQGKRNNWTRAIELHQQALTVAGDKASATIFILAGFAYANTKNWYLAAQYFSLGLKAARGQIASTQLCDMVRFYDNLATADQALFAQYKVDAAIAQLLRQHWQEEGLSEQQIATIGPHLPAYMMTIGALSLVKKEQWQPAAELLDRAFEAYASEKNGVPSWLLAKAASVQLQLRDGPKAILFYEKACQAAVVQLPIADLQGIAQAYHSLGNWQQAADKYLQVLNSDANNSLPFNTNVNVAQFVQDFLGASVAMPYSLLCMAAPTIGELCVKLNKWNEAITIYERLLALVESNQINTNSDQQVQWLAQAARAYQMQNNWPVAVALFERVLTYKNDDPNGLYMIRAAEGHTKLYNYQRAAQLYERYLSLFGNDIDVKQLAYAAFVQAQLGQWWKAKSHYARYLAARDVQPTAGELENAAFVYQKIQNGNKAVDLYTKALIAYGNNPPVRCLANAALTLRKLGNYDLAFSCYERIVGRVLTLNPNL